MEFGGPEGDIGDFLIEGGGGGEGGGEPVETEMFESVCYTIFV